MWLYYKNALIYALNVKDLKYCFIILHINHTRMYPSVRTITPFAAISTFLIRRKYIFSSYYLCYVCVHVKILPAHFILRH